MEVAGLLLVLLPWLANAVGEMTDATLHITRQNLGDIFHSEDVPGSSNCSQETCGRLSSNTASALSALDPCTCRCQSRLQAFREDLRICVDDIHECVLAPFVGGGTSQTIPFVFLPLKGQIIHPSKEINFSGVQTPVCAVSGAKFLTDGGWMDLRNPIDTDVPFRLFRDEGRTFLQWVGESDLRNKMSGRLILVYLMCRELAAAELLTPRGYTLFSPCVAFRVAGSPIKHLSNVSEVAFSLDARTNTEHSNRLSVSEYVAIGTCSVLLGLIYVASVLLYVQMRKRHKEASRKTNNQNLTGAEEGIVKNNPLLTMSAHFQPADNLYSDSTNSDGDIPPDVIQHANDKNKNAQITSALVHSQYQRVQASSMYLETHHQESAHEKLPEENVSIVETLEVRDERVDSFKALTGTARRKLYFNPAYFEPQLLLAPPPAALEFLAKIREVISIAKQKMASKRFAPSLMGIPEEDNSHGLESQYDNPKPSISRRSSLISLKRENSRRRTCSGCPGCEPSDFNQLCGKLPQFPALAACRTCTMTGESKQRSIRKWLEDIPVLEENRLDNKIPKKLRSPSRSLPDGDTPLRTLSPRPASERAASPVSSIKFRTVSKRDKEEHQYDTVHSEERSIMNFPPPDMIHEAMVVDNRSDDIRMPTLTKRQMKAVINELIIQRGDIAKESTSKRKIDYETDSLERSNNNNNKGYSTPTEYADLSSSQPSPSLSTALPMEEEMTMRNAIFNKKTGNMTISKINVDTLYEEDHEYELIVLKKGSLRKQQLYKLPELLQGNNNYSLVSEVYVNNGYNYGSAPSSPSDSTYSTLDRRTLKIRYEDGVEKPGKLLIEVEDCPDNYIPVHDSDSFEPDTLDRKPRIKMNNLDDEYIDSLERPTKILLRSSGSFKKDTTSVESCPSNFNRGFGSLREIYEAKTKGIKPQIVSNEGRLLTFDERHSKRQRRMTTLGNIVPPDLIPPLPLDTTPIYEKPGPPRKVELEKKPPLPPKNVISRSVNASTAGGIGGTPDKIWKKQEDSGYLSTDSSDSPKLDQRGNNKASESEDSVDGHSESGAESVETHSVFFGSFRKPSFTSYGSMDSGVESMTRENRTNLNLLAVNERLFS